MGRDAIELAARATQAGDPHERLAAVTALREELDALEAMDVAEALQAGSSWSQIAKALGVTRQAAHKRHARRAAPPAPRGRAHGLTVAGPARVAVALARHEAGRRGQRTIDTEHVLLGVLGVDGVAARAMKSVGVTLESAAAQVDEFTPPGGVPEDRAPVARLPLSRQARSALEQSMREVVALGDRTLGPEHLLLALVREDDSAAVRVLAGLGVSPQDVTGAVAAARGRD